MLTGMLALIIGGLRMFKLITLPKFLEEFLFGQESAEAAPKNDDSELLQFLINNPPDDSGAESPAITISADNFKRIISEMTLPEEFHTLSSATYYSNGNIMRKETSSLTASGGKYRCMITVNGVNSEEYISDGVIESAENFASGNVTRKTVSALFPLASLPHTPDPRYYLSLLDSGTVETVTLTRSFDDAVATVTYSIPQLNQTEIIEISLDTGFIQSIQTFRGDVLFYKCSVLFERER